MLVETGRGRRRLYLPTDRCHPDRRNCKSVPQRQQIPEAYHPLLDWYDESCDSAGPSRAQDPILALRGLGKNYGGARMPIAACGGYARVGNEQGVLGHQPVHLSDRRPRRAKPSCGRALRAHARTRRRALRFGTHAWQSLRHTDRASERGTSCPESSSSSPLAGRSYESQGRAASDIQSSGEESTQTAQAVRSPVGLLSLTASRTRRLRSNLDWAGTWQPAAIP